MTADESRKGISDVRITMIGGGYVGLVSGACFAEFGTEVTVVEADRAEARRTARRPNADLRTGPGAAGARKTSRPAAWPSPTTSPPAVTGSEAVFIAVGTPTRRGDGHADLTYVYAAANRSPAP